MDKKYFIKKNGKFLVNVPVMKLYVPETYFKNNMAMEQGSDFKIYGIFKFSIHDKISDNKATKYHLLKYPTFITVNYDSIVKADLDLGNGIVDKYRVIILTEGMVFLKSDKHIQSVKDVKMFLDLLNYGRLNILKYSELIKLFHLSTQLNKIDLGVPSVVLEMMVAELCRVYNKYDTVFRTIAGKPNVSDDLFSMITLKDLAHFSSTFTSLAFEDMNKGILMSVKRQKFGDSDKVSPVEKLIHF